LSVATLLACPTCRGRLTRTANQYCCDNSHSFDVASEGYVNLLLVQHRHSDDPGYNKEMIACRRDFFDAGYYQQLADEIATLIVDCLPTDNQSVVLDAGCGEGYYVRRFASVLQAGQPTHPNRQVAIYGFDISKHGVQIAAKRDPHGIYAVASTYRMPLVDDSVDVLLTQFSPISAPDFAAVLKPGGVVLVGGPGPHHLYALKELLYDTPELHEANVGLTSDQGFELIVSHEIRYQINVRGAKDVADLLKMTPFYWAVGEQSRARLTGVDALDLEVHVLVAAYRYSGTATSANDKSVSDN
jgi:23S rRNA (guanine745-N1)-methyltransferase